VVLRGFSWIVELPSGQSNGDLLDASGRSRDLQAGDARAGDDEEHHCHHHDRGERRLEIRAKRSHDAAQATACRKGRAR
jgi:hypothetical protein